MPKNVLYRPQRKVRLTASGRRELALSAAPILGVLAVTTWAFFRRPQPLAVEISYGLLTLVGIALLWRIGSIWLDRIEVVRTGAAVRAVVVEIGPRLAGARFYRAWYTAEAQQFAAVALAPAGAAEIGDSVTVLRLQADGRERSALERLCGCEAADRDRALADVTFTRS